MKQKTMKLGRFEEGRLKKRMWWTSKLPLEIIENILLRLPVKSVIRCKSVCKGWFSLISEPYFVKTHLHQPQTQARSWFCIIDDGEPDINYSTQIRAFTTNCEAFSDDSGGSMGFNYLFNIGNFKYPVKLLDSCDGLLCIVDFDGKIVLWNPSTRQCNLLPPNPNTCYSSGCHGFGFDSSTDDYKVVAVSIVLEHGGLTGGYEFEPSLHNLNVYSRSVVDVFSLKSNKWKRIEAKHSTTVLGNNATFLHGVVHWIGFGSNDDDWIHGFHRIIAFDLEKEQFREMAMPMPKGMEYSKMSVVGGCLYLLNYNNDPTEIWVMKEYGIDTSWSKITSPYNCSIDLRRSSNITNQHLFKCKLLSILNDEHLLFVNQEKLTLYDQKQKTCKNYLCRKRTCKNMYRQGIWFVDFARLYLETLVSPHPSEVIIKEE